MMDEADDLTGAQVLTDDGPGYVETKQPGPEGLYIVDLHDSEKSLYMRRDEVEDAIERNALGEAF